MKRPSKAVLIAAISVTLAGCSANTSGEAPSGDGIQRYEAAVAASSTGSGIAALPQSVALSLGAGVCSQLDAGKSPGAVVDSFGIQTEQRFPPQAAAEITIDAAEYLCPKHYPELQRWADR